MVGRSLSISSVSGLLDGRRQLLFNIGIVAFSSVGVKLAGMVRDIILASHFGTTDSADAFIAAWAIPQFLAVIFGNALSGVIIPLRAEARAREGEKHSRDFLNEMLLISILILGLVTLLLIPLRDVLLPLVTSNFGPEKLAETEKLWNIMLPGTFLFAICTVWSGILNTDERFGLAALSPILIPIFTIAALWIYPEGGIYSPAVGFVIGLIAQALWLIWGLYRLELVIFPKWHGGLTQTHMAMGQFVPYLANGVVFGGVGIVDQAMAATLGAGSLAILSYGNKIVLPVLGIGSAALATVVYPRFAQMVAERKWERLYVQVRSYLALTLVITIPMMIVLVLLAEPLIRLVFERGEFTAEDTIEVAQVHVIYALMIPSYTIAVLLSRVLNAMRATKYVLLSSIVIFAFNIIADYVFKEWIGIQGIALATVMNYTLSLAFNAWLVRRLITREIRKAATV